MSGKWYNYLHMTFQIGQRIGSYRVLRHIGSGGMDEVKGNAVRRIKSRVAAMVEAIERTLYE